MAVPSYAGRVSEAIRLAIAADPLLRRTPALAVLLQGLPLALGLASHAVINLVDMALVGRLGEQAVLAAHVGSTWNFLPMIVGNCLSIALLARLSRRLGSGDVAGARALNVRAQWLMLWLGIVVGVVTALPAAFMVDRTGLTGSVRDDAVHYLVASNLGCLPMFVLMQTTAAMRAAGEALVPLLLLLLANVVNLLLAIVLLYGWPAAGVPAVGVVGAAYGAVAGRSLAAVLAVWWLWRSVHPLSLRGAGSSLRPPVVRPLFADAWPQILQIGLRAALVILLTSLVVHHFGDGVGASLGITTRFDTLVLFSSLGFANAATAYAGRAVGVGWASGARASGLWAAAQAGLLGAVLVLVVASSATTLIGWFLPSPSAEVVDATTLYFQRASWAQVFGAVALGAIGALQGAGRMRAPLVVDLIGFTIAFAALGFVAGEDDLRSLYGALIAGMAVVAVLQVGFLTFARWPRPEELSR